MAICAITSRKFQIQTWVLDKTQNETGQHMRISNTPQCRIFMRSYERKTKKTTFQAPSPTPPTNLTGIWRDFVLHCLGDRPLHIPDQIGTRRFILPDWPLFVQSDWTFCLQWLSYENIPMKKEHNHDEKPEQNDDLQN